jgi:15-cis-phytoene synthase
MGHERTIFSQGSRTFFMSSLFFPRNVRRDVFELYSFVRIADDFVDKVPADTDGFYHFRSQWEQAVNNPAFPLDKAGDDPVEMRVIKNMLRVSRKYDFDPKWTEAFLNAMQSDLSHKVCETLDDTLSYIYGSAEVIGLMMARIMGLPPEANTAAKLQGRAMQMINFIRDIDEDNKLGRQYLPLDELERFGLPNLLPETAAAQPDDFKKFIHFQIERYNQWQDASYEGYKYIPKRLRIPLQTATDMYNWTARGITKDPLVVFKKKLKPSRARLVARIMTILAKQTP